MTVTYAFYLLYGIGWERLHGLDERGLNLTAVFLRAFTCALVVVLYLRTATTRCAGVARLSFLPVDDGRLEKRLKLSNRWKEYIARVVKNPLVFQLMRLGIRVVVSRHRIGVGVVGFNKRKEVLLLRHVFHPKSPWGIPGGWLDRHEAPADCALRELREETGIETAVLGPVININRENPPAHLGIYYEAEIDQDPTVLSAEIIEWAWFDTDNLPDNMLLAVRQAIEKAAENNKLRIMNNEL